MPYNRRSILSAIACALPLGLGQRANAATPTDLATPPKLRFRPFEEAVRQAFGHDTSIRCRRVEVGHSDEIRAGVQGCHNDRPFAGFPTGHLRIVRCSSEPGPLLQGVRLYVCSVDVVHTGGHRSGEPSRPLNFGSLPPAPSFS